MVPQAILMLEKMPLTRQRQDQSQGAAAARGDLPPTAPRAMSLRPLPPKQTIAEIWSELLKLDKIGIHDDFFAGGGHSLLATRLVSRIRRAFNVELPLRAVFEGPTIAAMSELVDTLGHQKLSAGGCDHRTETLPGPGDAARASGASATLLCPAAALVPGQARRLQQRIQHAQGLALER